MTNYEKVNSSDEEMGNSDNSALYQMKRQLKSNIRYLKLYSVVLLLLVLLQGAYLVVYHTDFYCRFGWTKCRTPKHQLPKKRNLIFMVSDGFGPTSETYARSFYQYLKSGQNPPTDNSILPLDTILVGTSRTRSYDSLITDSAAGATAFSCMMKSYNNAIAVNGTKSPCPTLMEVAKMAGYKTGIVVRSRTTDATPGAFSSHAIHRKYEPEIAYQQVGFGPLGRTLDLIMGGGRCFYKPNSDPSSVSCRKDNLDLEKEASENLGYKTVISSRKEFDQLTGAASELPLLALLHDGDMSYEIDRDPSKEPSLAEMTSLALKSLADASKDQEQGFFLLVEGSRIDHAAHGNDAAAHAHEILAYQETIQVVKDFVEARDDSVMLSTSDHETGGVSLGRQMTPDYPDYIWYPEVIAAVRNSTDVAVNMLLSQTSSEKKSFISETLLPVMMGIEDFSESDVDKLANLSEFYATQSYLAELVNKRARIKFTTHGHTGVDVNVYAYAGKNVHALSRVRRNQENTDLGVFMKDLLQLETDHFETIRLQLEKAVADGTLILKPSAALAESESESRHDKYHWN